jgi:hypothetical protein
MSILAREVFDAETVGRADADALHDAVGQYRQRFAGLGREQQHQSDVAGIWSRRYLDPAHVVALPRPGHDVGIDADGADAQFRNDAVH